MMTKKIGMMVGLGLCLIVLAGKMTLIYSEPLSPNPFFGKTVAEITSIFNEDVLAISRSEDSQAIKAQKLAELGETALEVPNSSEFAIYAFDKALAQDASNSKANFYSALLNPVLALRGIAIRMVKILTPDVVSRETYNILNGIREPNAKKVMSNLLNDVKGEKIFKTPTEVQEFIASKLLPILAESKRRLKVVAQDQTFQLTFDTRAWSSELHKNKPRRKIQVMLDQVEVHAAQVALTGIEALAKMAVSYNLDAGLAIRDQFMGKENVNYKMVFDAIRKYPQALTLRPGGEELLKSIPPMASDVVEGLKIIANLVREIEDRNDVAIVGSFRNRDRDKTNPDEDYNELMMSLQFVIDLLAGPVHIGVYGERYEWGCDEKWNYWHKEYKTEIKKVLMNGTVLFSKPLQDLKPVILVDMDEKGRHMVNAPDSTFGGLFPNGDMITTWHSFGDNPKWWISIDCLVNYRKEGTEQK